MFRKFLGFFDTPFTYWLLLLLKQAFFMKVYKLELWDEKTNEWEKMYLSGKFLTRNRALRYRLRLKGYGYHGKFVRIVEA